LNRKLLEGVPRNSRDALDLAGKLPLAVKALSIDVSVDELLIDVAHAGGLHGKSDGGIVYRHRRNHNDVLDPRLLST